MASKLQVVIDCADPGRLAAFWANALDYKLEDPPSGHASWEDWLKAMHIPPEHWNDRSAIVDPRGVGPRLFFQKVPEPKTVKNRFHLDLHQSEGNPPPEERQQKAKTKAAQLVAAGATILYEMSEYGSTWLTLADPEGNEFCVG